MFVIPSPQKLNNFRISKKGFFPNGNYSRVFSQVATSRMCNLPRANFPSLSWPQRLPHAQPNLAAALGPLGAALGPHSSLRRLRRPNLTFGKLPLGKLHIWEVSTWEIVTREVALGKMPLGKYLRPYLFVYMFPIAAQTAGPNGLKFVEGTQGYPGPRG